MRGRGLPARSSGRYDPNLCQAFHSLSCDCHCHMHVNGDVCTGHTPVLAQLTTHQKKIRKKKTLISDVLVGWYMSRAHTKPKDQNALQIIQIPPNARTPSDVVSQVAQNTQSSCLEVLPTTKYVFYIIGYRMEWMDNGRLVGWSEREFWSKTTKRSLFFQ